MTTAVEPVATELSVGSFHNQLDAPKVPTSFSPAVQHNGASKLAFGFDRVLQAPDSPTLPHWMDSKQIPIRPNDLGSRIEFLPEMGPSTPMQETPKQKHNVETQRDQSDPVLHSMGAQHDGQKMPLPFEFVQTFPYLKQVLQSCSTAKVYEEPQNQKENMLTFCLGTPKSVVHATPKGAQQRHRVGQPPSTRALATLAASKIALAPEDLQLQQPVKAFQQCRLLESHQPAASVADQGIKGQEARGTVISTSAAGRGSMQLDLLKASADIPTNSSQHLFTPAQLHFRALPRDLIVDGGIALHLQDGSLQAEPWLRRSTLASTVPRWLDMYTPTAGQTGTQLNELTPGYTSKATRSPGKLLAPLTPSEGGAYASGALGKQSMESVEDMDMKVYSNLSRKRKIASPEKATKNQRVADLTGTDPNPGVAEGTFRHPSKQNGSRNQTEIEHPVTTPNAPCGVGRQPQFPLDMSDASREHKFFPGRNSHQVGLATASDGKTTPSGFRDHLQFASPKKEQGQKPGVGSSVASPSAFALVNNLKNPQFVEGTPECQKSRGGRYYAVPAHSPMPVPDPAISAGEPSLPLSLNFAHKIGQSSKVQTGMSSMKSDSDWGKSLALAASPIMQDSPFRQRYAELQMYLKYCDEARHEHLVEVFRSMSAAGRSGHALRLETRALWLNLEEGKEMDRIKSLNIMGAQARGASTSELGCTPHGPRLPAPGNTPAS